MFYFVNETLTINLDHVVEIRTTKTGDGQYRREFVGRDGVIARQERLSATGLNMDNVGQPLIPAQPGFYVLSLIECYQDSHESKTILEKTPVIAWAQSDFGWLIPVCLDPEIGSSRSAILTPDGHVEEPDDGAVFESLAQWLHQQGTKKAEREQQMTGKTKKGA